MTTTATAPALLVDDARVRFDLVNLAYNTHEALMSTNVRAMSRAVLAAHPDAAAARFTLEGTEDSTWVQLEAILDQSGELIGSPDVSEFDRQHFSLPSADDANLHLTIVDPGALWVLPLFASEPEARSAHDIVAGELHEDEARLLLEALRRRLAR